ncbi:hypothetical protein L5876_05010 [Hyphobacterium sp. SN044]|uniref:hypothetical protein n=1 Tax=Hyphobacterium sp. SN044 TaxID=2912575 RepID=UPI001F444910|nr:hypothetical protein [Hyphobacterium sp. SN044]MCF8879169.1 hypothetical protein [Hyphobacterium sp. SN044]
MRQFIFIGIGLLLTFVLLPVVLFLMVTGLIALNAYQHQVSLADILHLSVYPIATILLAVVCFWFGRDRM